MVRCPGQDQRFWKPDDTFEVTCPGCAEAMVTALANENADYITS